METTYPFYEIKNTVERFLERFEAAIMKEGWNIIEVEIVEPANFSPYANKRKSIFAYSITQFSNKQFGYPLTSTQKESVERYGFKTDESGILLSFDNEIFNSNKHLWSAQELNLI